MKTKAIAFGVTEALLFMSCFGFVLVAINHSMAPIALLMIYMGQVDLPASSPWFQFFLGSLLSWIGAAMLVEGFWRTRPEVYVRHHALGGAIVLSGWFIFLVSSSAPGITLLLSVPFLACLSVHAINLWLFHRAIWNSAYRSSTQYNELKWAMFSAKRAVLVHVIVFAFAVAIVVACLSGASPRGR